MSATLADLPDDVLELIRPHQTDTPEALDAIGVEIAAKRDEAKAARKTSGIEATWLECEEAYVGIDDANRHEFSEARWAKPMSIDGPVTTNKTPRADHKSTLFIPITARYVNAGVAKLGEILLPADGKAFSFTETPVPDLIQAKDDTRQVVHSGLGVPLTRPQTPDETGQPPQPGAAPQQVPLTVKDLALENIEIARKKAKAAETRIYDWMVEGRFRAEIRKVIADAARIGVGVVKSPAPKSKRGIAVTAEGEEVKVQIKERIIPSTSWVDPWNFFPDPACGEDIHDGSYVFERDYLSERQLRGLKKLPGYIATQIDKVLKEGPEKSAQNGGSSDTTPGTVKNKNRYQVWYFYGALTKDDMAVIDAAAGKDPVSQDDEKEVYAIVTLVNESVIKATINPLGSGEFPYHSMPWERRSQHWAGVGVAERMRSAQKIVNSAWRALLNNAGKSADNQYVIDQGGIRPADGSMTITPGKVWYKTADAPPDVRQAFMAIQIPSQVEALSKIIEMGAQLAEETTSIPLISQGQSGTTTPETFGAAQLQNNNANQLLRSIGYAFDDYITEPVVRQHYEWLLLDPDVPNEEKGEFQIDAHGSVALVERAIQDQSIAQMGGMAANPIYGIDPKKWAAEFIRSKKLDPKTLQYTEEEQAKIDAQPPPEAPVVTAAKVNADTQLKLGVMKQQADAQSIQSEEKIEQAANVLEGGRLQNEQHRTVVESTVKLHEIQMQHERALLEYANARNISLDQAKAQLAKTAMQLQTEERLNAQNAAVEVHKTRSQQIQRGPRGPRPAVQAPGRAANGQAASQVPA